MTVHADHAESQEPRAVRGPAASTSPPVRARLIDARFLQHSASVQAVSVPLAHERADEAEHRIRIMIDRDDYRQLKALYERLGKPAGQSWDEFVNHVIRFGLDELRQLDPIDALDQVMLYASGQRELADAIYYTYVTLPRLLADSEKRTRGEDAAKEQV